MLQILKIIALTGIVTLYTASYCTWYSVVSINRAITFPITTFPLNKGRLIQPEIQDKLQEDFKDNWASVYWTYVLHPMTFQLGLSDPDTNDKIVNLYTVKIYGRRYGFKGNASNFPLTFNTATNVYEFMGSRYTNFEDAWKHVAKVLQ